MSHASTSCWLCGGVQPNHAQNCGRMPRLVLDLLSQHVPTRFLQAACAQAAGAGSSTEPSGAPGRQASCHDFSADNFRFFVCAVASAVAIVLRIDKYTPEACIIIGNYYSLKGEHEKAALTSVHQVTVCLPVEVVGRCFCHSDAKP